LGLLVAVVVVVGTVVFEDVADASPFFFRSDPLVNFCMILDMLIARGFLGTVGVPGAVLPVESNAAKPVLGERRELDLGEDKDEADRVPSEGGPLESGVRMLMSVATDVLSVAIVTASVSAEWMEKSSSSVRMVAGEAKFDNRRDF
jgi:hypothetical protein